MLLTYIMLICYVVILALGMLKSISSKEYDEMPIFLVLVGLIIGCINLNFELQEWKINHYRGQ